MMKDIANNLPSAEDIIRALGIDGRANGHGEVLPGFALFGAGLLVGAGLALIFAPTTGEQLRQQISAHLGELRNQVAGAAESAQQQSAEH